MNTPATLYLEADTASSAGKQSVTAEPGATSTMNVSARRVLAAVKVMGAATVAAAMGLFLYEGAGISNDIERFVSMLGFGAFLTVLGLGVNRWLGDRVASRLFIALSLASISVITAVLGALAFSLTETSATLSLPDLVTWQLVDTASLAVLLPLGLLVVTAIAAFGFRVLARSESRWMTIAMVCSSALLLLPTRDELWIALSATVAVSTLVVVVRKQRVNSAVFYTMEGRWALLMLFVPPAIMVLRTIALYQTNWYLALYATAAACAACRYWLTKTEFSSRQNAVAGLATMIAAVYATDLAGQVAKSILLASDLTPAYTLILLAIALDITRKMPTGFILRAIHQLLCLRICIQLLSMANSHNPDALMIFLTIVVVAPFMVNYAKRGWYLEAATLLVAVLGAGAIQIDSVLNFVLSTGWWGVAALGIAALVGGSALEKFALDRRSDCGTRTGFCHSDNTE